MTQNKNNLFNEYPLALAPGTRLEEFEIKHVLGQGAGGIVYLAWDHDLKELVAIKECLHRSLENTREDGQVLVPHPSRKKKVFWPEGLSHFIESVRFLNLKRRWPRVLNHFIESARLLNHFRHPNIVQVRGAFKANNTAYMVMDYVKGEALNHLISKKGVISEEQVKKIIFQILDVVEQMHKAGLVNPDIQEGNVIIRKDQSAILIDIDRVALLKDKIEEKQSNIYYLSRMAYIALTGDREVKAWYKHRDCPGVLSVKACRGSFLEKVKLGLFEKEKLPRDIAEFRKILES